MIKILRYKSVEKNNIQGVIDIEFPTFANFQIYGILIFKKENSRFISFPSRKVDQPDQKPKFFPYCKFKEAGMNQAFQKKLLEALEGYLLSDEYKQSLQKKAESQEEDVPF